MTNDLTRFWLALLRFGITEEERIGHWNQFLFDNFRPYISDNLDDRDLSELTISLPFPKDYTTSKRDLINFLINYERSHGFRLKPDSLTKLPHILDFSGHSFSNRTSFSQRLMIGVNFSKSTFEGYAAFDHTKFIGPANFDNARFTPPELDSDEALQYNASFSRSIFYGPASFRGTHFPSTTNFKGAKFKAHAVFADAEFLGQVDFGDAEFQSVGLPSNDAAQQRASFDRTIFKGSATFENTNFSCIGTFKETIFEAQATFVRTQFQEQVAFDGANFHSTAFPRDHPSPQDVSFAHSIFRESTSFINTTFPRVTSFEGAAFTKGATFEGAEFQGSTDFGNAKFYEVGTRRVDTPQHDVTFSESTFRGLVSFKGTKFPPICRFEEVTFHRRTVFDDADFFLSKNLERVLSQGTAPSGLGALGHDLSFLSSSFLGSVSFRSTKFPYTTSFEKVAFRGPTAFDEAVFQGPVKFDLADFLVAEQAGTIFGQRGASFSSSAFHGLASFEGTRFPVITSFNSASFGRDAVFDGAEFRGSATFDGLKFEIVPPENEGATSQKLSFSCSTFGGSASFNGIVFPHVCHFGDAQFKGQASFNDAEFQGSAAFDGAIFQGGNISTGKGTQRATSFSGATFQGPTSFHGAKFLCSSDFGSTEFRGLTNFHKSVFATGSGKQSAAKFPASFRSSRFRSLADFREAHYADDVEFDNSEIDGEANFGKATFDGVIRFHNCKFRSTTSFRGAVFRKPPDFFDAHLHEDLDFGEVDWKKSEASYFHTRRQRREMGKSADEALGGVDHAIRSWDRLALIMSQRERPNERHEFFRLKMRAVRQRGRVGLLWVLNKVFEVTSDYGWSVGWAMVWWLVSLCVGGVALAAMTLGCSWNSASEWWHVLPTIPDGLALSFANSHAFLGLASEGGWLSDSRVAIEKPCKDNGLSSLIDYVGFVQAVLGPILLFLVLLTLRNRFRLG